MPSEYVEVLFNYKYDTSEGRHITINKGDKFALLAKSTEEWWKVRRGDREKFYVPANYVRVVSEPNKVRINNKTTEGASDSISIHTDIPDLDTNSSNGHKRNGSNTSTNDSLDSQSRSDSFGSQGDGYPHHSMDRNATLPKPNITPAAPTSNGVAYMNSSMLKLDLKPSITVSQDTPSPDTEQVDYANMEIIKEIIAQRKENENLQSCDNGECETWEMHTDDDSGKAYYFNSVTKETTWDSPIIKRRSNLSAKDVFRASASPVTTKRLSRITSFRKGWTETIADDGSKIYVHNATGDKWHMAIDASGKEYYYKENSQESLWELPEGGYTPRNAGQSASAFDTQKKGYLNRAKVTEGKKKVKKFSWSLSYIVAYDNNLLIYKDEKAATSKPEAEFGKPEAIIDLRNATVDWSTKDKSTRKNVIEIMSASGTGYLLQHDDNLLIHQWHTIILGKVKKFNPSAADSSLSPPEKERDGLLTIPEMEGNNNNDVKHRGDLSNKRKQHSRRLSKSNAAQRKRDDNFGGGKTVYTFHEDNSEFQAPSTQGPAGEVVKLSIRDKLRKFLTKRPSPESLEKQGILQTENVFGSRLQFICDREQTTVPKFVVRCIKTIERKGLDFDGLYRISGNQAQIQKLRYLVDSTDDYNLTDYDINVLTGALKLFFRELKEPLIPFKLYNILSDTIRDKDQARKLRTMKLQLATMPTVNLDTLKHLFAHLVRVLEHASENRMRSQNIAIVLGPTLMWPEKESSAIAVNMMCQNSIVEYILSAFDRLF